jgi:hypothetical protein
MQRMHTLIYEDSSSDFFRPDLNIAEKVCAATTEKRYGNDQKQGQYRFYWVKEKYDTAILKVTGAGKTRGKQLSNDSQIYHINIGVRLD